MPLNHGIRLPLLLAVILVALAYPIAQVSAQLPPLSLAAIAYTPQSSACLKGTELVRSAGTTHPTLEPGGAEVHL